MTSGNFSNLPLVKDNHKALTELGSIADYFLLHNRDILSRCDDSLLRVMGGERQFYRRSRGYVPEPIEVPLPPEAPVILGIGGEMKNSFCLLKGKEAFMSTYIGEIDCVEGEDNLRESVFHLQKLLDATPTLIAFDSHPNYASAAVARQMSAKKYFPIQHHHSHLAACMAENNLDNSDIIGAILDGTGYGTDGNLWGFEIISGAYTDFQRHWHLSYIPLPGGEAAVRQPWRTAVAYLVTLLAEEGKDLAWRLFPENDIEIIAKMMQNSINSPLSSGCGRLFDAIAAILGVCLETSYEGQGAVELANLLPQELLLNPTAQAEWQPYPFELGAGVIDMRKMLAAILEDQKNKVPVPIISLRFHQTLVSIVGETVDMVAAATGCRQVALSGGVWQNPYLLHQAKNYFLERGYQVYFHRQVPANDGGIALGQAMIAYWRWRKECV
jgi:hydrogenase maturation protein HypF